MTMQLIPAAPESGLLLKRNAETHAEARVSRVALWRLFHSRYRTRRYDRPHA